MYGVLTLLLTMLLMFWCSRSTQLVHNVITGKSDAQCGFGKAYMETATNATAVNELTIEQQLHGGLL
jgi:hypothetical protein